MPDFLTKQKQGWYAVLEIPASLRPHFGKVRFKQSLKTGSRSVAKDLALPIVVEWKKQIAIARGMSVESDATLASIQRVRQHA